MIFLHAGLRIDLWDQTYFTGSKVCGIDSLFHHGLQKLWNESIKGISAQTAKIDLIERMILRQMLMLQTSTSFSDIVYRRLIKDGLRRALTDLLQTLIEKLVPLTLAFPFCSVGILISIIEPSGDGLFHYRRRL